MQRRGGQARGRLVLTQSRRDPKSNGSFAHFGHYDGSVHSPKADIDSAEAKGGNAPIPVVRGAIRGWLAGGQRHSVMSRGIVVCELVRHARA
jgi:hypothetical protein